MCIQRVICVMSLSIFSQLAWAQAGAMDLLALRCSFLLQAVSAQTEDPAKAKRLTEIAEKFAMAGSIHFTTEDEANTAINDVAKKFEKEALEAFNQGEEAKNNFFAKEDEACRAFLNILAQPKNTAE